MILRLILDILLGESGQFNATPITASTDIPGLIPRIAQQPNRNLLLIEKMKVTYEYRQKLMHDEDATSSVLDVFPHFLDIPRLVRMFLYCFTIVKIF